MKQRFAAAFAGVACAIIWVSAAHADTYNLTNEFTSVNNPGSVWSITYGATRATSTVLPTQSAVGNNGNHLEPAIPGAYYGTGTNLNADVPFAFQSAKDGSQLSLLNDGDFLTGDVVVHTPNAQQYLYINWTAPTDGTITDFKMTVWYAHSSVDRANVMGAILPPPFGDTGPLYVTSKTNSPDRDHPSILGTVDDYNVTAGTILTLWLIRSSSDLPGSLTGVQFTVDFTPATTGVPIPGALPLFASGLAGIGALAWRRKRKAAA